MHAALAQQDIIVDSNASARALSGDFDQVRVRDGIDLYLSQSGQVGLAVSAATENEKNGIRAEIDNGVLNIFFRGDRSRKKAQRPLRAYVAFKVLKKIEASGNSDIVVAGTLSLEALELHLSGVCNFKGAVKTGSLKIDLDGASDVQVSGTATSLSIKSSGASDVHGFGLEADNADVQVSGSSDIQITVNKTLSARAGGFSGISYRGDAVIKALNSSGASSISKVN
jgi:hypothetical protein